MGLLWLRHFPPLTDSACLPQNRAVNQVPTSASSKVGFVLIFLFGMPFAAFGLWAFSQAIHQIGSPQPGQSFLYPLVFGLIFSGVGFGLIYLALKGNRWSARQQYEQAEHPSEPWLWRDDWAAGRVRSNTKTTMTMAWIFAIFWNLISWTIASFAVPAALKQRSAAGFFVLLFPAIGIVLLIYAIRQTIALIEFGKTCFEMASVPGVVGRELKGSIQARFPHSPDHGVHLRLSCVHRYVTGSGNNSTTNENILWRDEAELNPGQLCVGPVGTTIPVSFHIPRDAQPTEKLSPRDEFLWLLEATASVPGVDYHDTFEVPIFRTAQTPTAAEEEAEEKAFAVNAPELSRPEHLTVQVQPVAEGTEFYFPAARNKSFALTTTLFTTTFGVITYFLAHSKAPVIFPVVFGGFVLLMFYVCIQMWLGTTRVVMGSSLMLQSGYLGGGRRQEIAFSDIDTIADRISGQQGGASGTPFYDVELKLRSGKKLTLGRTLRNMHEAEWLVSEMRRLSGIEAKSMTAGAR
jgi:hypothetical protein